MNRLSPLACSIAMSFLASSMAFAANAPKAAAPAQIGAPGVVHISLQPWQVRRAAYESLVQRLRRGDFAAGRDYNAVLTEFDTRLFSRTPIEELEILGDFYIPKQGVDPALIVVVQNLVLGWYDVLRFASKSGQAEILNNEGFFRIAFTRGGPGVTKSAVNFIQSQPDRVRALIDQGMTIADKYRETNNYDRHWPTAYGLERFACAQGGACKAPAELPKRQWDQAWQQARSQVYRYFNVAAPSDARR